MYSIYIVFRMIYNVWKTSHQLCETQKKQTHDLLVVAMSSQFHLLCVERFLRINQLLWFACADEMVL